MPHDRPRATKIRISALGLILLTAGCFNYNIRLQQEDHSVKPVLTGSDCAYTVFNLGGGDITFENAMKEGYVELPDGEPGKKINPEKISKVHSAELQDLYVLFFGMRCLEVKGE